MNNGACGASVVASDSDVAVDSDVSGDSDVAADSDAVSDGTPEGAGVEPQDAKIIVRINKTVTGIRVFLFTIDSSL